MRVLIAPDKFKGSLTAREAAEAMAAGWRDVFPDAEIILRPVADGGEGTAEAVCEAMGGRWIECEVRDPLGRTITARYALVEDSAGEQTAIVECSAASGYLLVKPAERDLPNSSTFGTGELLLHALNESGATKVIVGLGGSATNDGGLGLAAALGYRFLDNTGKAITPVPDSLKQLARIVPPDAQPWHACPITVACDVQNPLLGQRGATRVYGPQKGLTAEQVMPLEEGLLQLADVASECLRTDYRESAGAGAAGGLGFGMLTFCQARLVPGFALIAQLLDLEKEIAQADIILTGEGAADAQSLEGKAPHGIAAMARSLGKPALLFAGVIPPEDSPALRKHFASLHALSEHHPLEDCLTRAAHVLQTTVSRAAAARKARPLPSKGKEANYS